MIEPVRFTTSRRADAVGLRLPPRAGRIDGRFRYAGLNPDSRPKKLWDGYHDVAFSTRALPPSARSRYEQVGLNSRLLPSRFFTRLPLQVEPSPRRYLETPLSQFSAKRLGMIR